MIAGSAATDVAAGAAPSPASGQPQVFGVHPVQQGHTTLPGGHFSFAIAAGESISDGVVVDNFTDRSLDFHIYGADLRVAAGGGLAPGQPNDVMHEAGAWIAVSTPTITIPAHDRFTDAFTLTVPSSVSPGEHLGAVVASADVGTSPQGSAVEARIALVTVITVPGVAHPSAKLSPLRASEAVPGQLGFDITLSNTGNLLLTYVGAVAVYDAQRHKVASLPLAPPHAYVVPAGQVPLAAVWTVAPPPPGQYSAQATVTILANGKPVGTLRSQSLELPIASGPSSLIMVGIALGCGLILALATWSLVRRAVRPSRVGIGGRAPRPSDSARTA